MHPGPINRGLEISSAAADSHRSTVLEQVANGVSVRMAALYLLLAGAPSTGVETGSGMGSVADQPEMNRGDR